MKNKKYDKILILYLIIYSCILIPILDIPSIMSDDGTHMILSLFYRDLITTILETKSLSFSKAYDFSLSYLIHYPKLQVFYPPLYHFVTGLIFYSLLGINSFAARFANFLFGIFCMLLIYIFSSRLTDKKSAIISVLIFSMYPITLFYIRLSMKDFAALFFSLLSIFLFFIVEKKKNLKYFFILGIVSSLAILSDRPAFTASLTVFILLLLKKEKLKNILMFLLSSVLLLVPYGLLILKIGGLGINLLIFSMYGLFTHFELINYSLLLPIILTLFVSFFSYIKKKKLYHKEFLYWFLISFPIIFLMAFKPRFFQFFLLPMYIVSGYWFRKRKKLLVLILFYSLTFSVYSIVTAFPTQPVKEAMFYINDNLPKEANVALITEDWKAYSSSFIFPLVTLDTNKSIVFLRSCYFEGKSREEILSILEDNSVYFVIAVKDIPEYQRVELIKDRLELVFEKNIIEIYKFKNYAPIDKICNYICTTKEILCTEYDSPFDVYKS